MGIPLPTVIQNAIEVLTRKHLCQRMVNSNEKKTPTILTNIIGGVKSGGQTYGKRKYGAYAGKAANADNEKTCTLGWAQNYGNEGRRLCQMILKADPKAFRTADTAGIEKKLSVDWEATDGIRQQKKKLH